MVFESIVVDLLNKYVGEYVENLDSRQLKIGIWGGDVELANLLLKQSALDELNLPVKTVYGHLGKLVLKIPWKNLYSSPTEATVEKLFLLVVPNQEIKYDPVKEEKWKQEAKQAEIEKVEAAKKRELDKDKPKADDTFTEKLTTQIVRNVQISIKDIHIRYEDRVTNPLSPFSFGITLHNLSVVTTDKDWMPAISQDITAKIFKHLTIDGLAIYWNSNTELFSKEKGKKLLSKFQSGIPTKGQLVEGYKYMIGPISCKAKLQMNTKPETDKFTVPKALLNIDMDKVQLKISKPQYRDLIGLVDSIDRMKRAAVYRKYRPAAHSYKGHYKEWWKYAYTCILEEDVLRKRRNWDWLHIFTHRAKCREYAGVYQEKLLVPNNKLNLKKCHQCEKDLDAFNIVLIRQKIEVEVERQGKLEEALRKADMEKQSSRGWFSWWGSSSPKDDEDSKRDSIKEQLEEAMTGEEKAKLFRAIDYQENSLPDDLPTTFIAFRVNFVLQCLEVEVRDDDKRVGKVMKVTLKQMELVIEQRPSANAIRVLSSMHELSVIGLKQNDVYPDLCSSLVDHGRGIRGDVPLVKILFETSPLCGTCDIRLLVNCRPMRVIYDAHTIIKLRDIFTPEDDHAVVHQLQIAYQMKMAEMKEKSALGLQHTIQQHARLDLRIDIMSSHLIVPHSGFYDEKNPILVYNIGQFSVTSKIRQGPPLNVKTLHKQGVSEDNILKQLRNESYDKFILKVEAVQVLLAHPGEDWVSTCEGNIESELHLLHPTNLTVEIEKCLISDDPRLPKVKIHGSLPQISIRIQEKRLLDTWVLLLSIPFSDNRASKPSDPKLPSMYASSTSVSKFDIAKIDKHKYDQKAVFEEAEEVIQFTDVDVHFELQEIFIDIIPQTPQLLERPLISLHVFKLEAQLLLQTYQIAANARLGGLLLVHNYEGSVIKMIDTPMASGKDEDLLVMNYLNADKASPEFHSRHGSVLQLINVEFSKLSLLIHQEALVILVQRVNDILMYIDEQTVLVREEHISTDYGSAIVKTEESTTLRALSSSFKALETIRESVGTAQSAKSVRRVSKKPVEVIDLKLSAVIEAVEVTISNKVRDLARLELTGGNGSIIMKRSYTQIDAKLTNLLVYDFKKNTAYPKMLNIVGQEELMSAQIVLYNEELLKRTKESVNMSVTAELACIRIVFLNRFLMSVINFMNNFQEAQEKLLEASAAAAEAARTNVRQAYTAAMKIKLNITLKAPIIIVPENSQSLRAMFFDFGHLTISNTFQDVATDNLGGQSAVLDHIRLNLVNLKVSRVVLNKQGDIQMEKNILQPITFQLSVHRNLSSSWYTDQPDLDVGARLGTVLVQMSKHDYVTLMSIVNENLAEVDSTHNQAQMRSSHRRSEGKSAHGHLYPSFTSKISENMSHVSSNGFSGKASKASSRVADITTYMKFNIRLESIVVELFTNTEIAVEKSSFLSTGPKKKPDTDVSLARVTLQLLCLKGVMLSDTTIASTILLLNFLVEDTRPSKANKINRYMERIVDCDMSTDTDSIDSKISHESQRHIPDVTSNRAMVDATVRMKGNSMFINLRIFSFVLILNLEHIMKLVDFFAINVHAGTDAVLAIPTTLETQSSSLEKPRQKSSGPVIQVLQDEGSDIQDIEEVTKSISFCVEKPEIILVENLEDINTNALNLQMELNGRLRLTGDSFHQVITASIKDLQMFTCCYNPEKRQDTKAQVLYPVSITLAGSTPDREGLHLDLSTTKIHLSVSPGTVELVNKCYTTLYDEISVEARAIVVSQDYSTVWVETPLNESEHWFLQSEVAEDALAYTSFEQKPIEEEKKKRENLSEICLISIPSLVITLEAGVGQNTLPVLLLESTVNGSVTSWSSKLTAEMQMTLQMAYYNNRLALWEPLIEPIEASRNGRSTFVPWEVTVQVKTMNDEGDYGKSSTNLSKEPSTLISVKSQDMMEVTLTKSCLEVLDSLNVSFQDAIYKLEAMKKNVIAPYVVQNDTGLTIIVELQNDAFKVFGVEHPERINEVVLEPGAKVHLFISETNEDDQYKGLDRSKSYIRAEMKSPSLRLVSLTNMPQQQRFMTLKVRETGSELYIPVMRADKRFFMLKKPGAGEAKPSTIAAAHEHLGLVVDITLDMNATIQVTLCSIIRIHNNFGVLLNVYYLTKKGDEVQLVASIPPHSHVNLPMQAVYTPTKELFFCIEGYSLSSFPYIWKNVEKYLTTSQLLQCNSKNSEDQEPMFIKVVGELEHIYFETKNHHTVNSHCINIYLNPTVVLKNFLPVDIICCVQGLPTENRIPSGERFEIPTCEPGSSSIVLRVSGYLDHEWSCKHSIAEFPEELEVWVFECYDSPQRITFELGMHSINKNGCLIMELYCPFWMINKTGLSLCYRRASKPSPGTDSSGTAEQPDDMSNNLFHPLSFKGPIMFSFRAKNFFGKKKVVIRVENGDWSDKFSLDVAGSYGVVNCQKSTITYQIGVHIQLMYNSLTKQVIFTPYHVLVNHCYTSILDCREYIHSARWETIEPGSCIPLYPLAASGESSLVVRVHDTDGESIPFTYDSVHNSLLKLNNVYGGISVDVQMTEGAVYISFADFKPELASALIVNHTPYNISMKETDFEISFTVSARHKKLFCWSSFNEGRMLIWNDDFQTDLYKDDVGEYFANGEEKAYFVSFLDGMQRILLFTSNIGIAHDAQNAGTLEQFDTEITIALHGIGLSLVDNFASKEILYLGITSSGVIWETQRSNKKRFKPLPEAHSMAIEDSYQVYLQKKTIEKDINPVVTISDPKLEVDFQNMVVLRPFNKLMERNYRTGFWVHMKQSKHQVQLHAKINRLQIDNQMLDCIFPVVLAPVPPPRSVITEHASKPFVEVSIVETVTERNAVKQFKYFKVLMQEFHIKLDVGFINSLLNFFEAGEVTEAEEANRFKKDCKLVDEQLMDRVLMLSSREQKHYYDFLHFSPIKMHISFSLSGGIANPGEHSALPPIYSVLTQSLGVTLTDMQDVIFKLSYFERQYSFLNQRQLLYEIQMHYIGQLIKQFYVLVFGLDVLGNPYGLVVGLKHGVEDLFYEPFQGAIQGPGEFAEGLYIGVKSLFGHTVGGAAGAMSRITGAMGKGLAALTFDEDYQKKRREQTVQSYSVQESITRGGKGIVMGVVGGIGGVITKPISGAKEEGVEGFFKGFGKGMVGLVTRPTAGVVDFASGTLSSVRRMTQLSEEVVRLRNPRYFKLDKLIRPYSRQEAEGNKILLEIDKGRFHSTDVYMYHTVIGHKDILLLTDKRIAYIAHSDMFGNPQTAWAHTWDELVEPPKVVDTGIVLLLQESKKKLFRCSSSKKLLIIPEENKKEVLLGRMMTCIASPGTERRSSSATSSLTSITSH